MSDGLYDSFIHFCRINSQRVRMPTHLKTRTQSHFLLPGTYKSHLTMATSTPPEESGPVYFWRDFGETYSFLSQWYPEPFAAPSVTPDVAGRTFATCEQYMMYRKAMLFEDPETAEEIMQAKTPKAQKALGRKVSGFTNEVWCSNRELIVVDGNWYRFTNPVCGSEDSKKKLLATGDRELVEVRRCVQYMVWALLFVF